MQFITLILAIGFLQVWGAKNPLHKDLWFYRWVDLVDKSPIGSRAARFVFLVAVGGVCFLLGVLFYLFQMEESWLRWLLLPISVVVLLYSMGRGEFSEIVSEYTKACYVEDWASSLARAEPLGVDAKDLNENDWSGLHERVLDEAAYRGFERMFSVLFWFFAFGPLGALMYRLLFLYCEHKREDENAAKLLWALEWPAVRLLGLSFCFTGNFAGGYKRWRESLFCVESTSRMVLSRMVMGALTVDEELDHTCEVTRKELNLLHRLYARSLWFWLGALAIITLSP